MDVRHYIAIGSNGSLNHVLADHPTRRTYGRDIALVLIGPLTEAQAVYGVMHPDAWVTQKELVTRCGTRTVEQVRAGEVVRFYAMLDDETVVELVGATC